MKTSEATESTQGSSIELPANSAALVIHADNTIELHLPKMDVDDDDSEVPVNALAAAALGTFAHHDVPGMQALVEKFVSGGFSD